MSTAMAADAGGALPPESPDVWAAWQASRADFTALMDAMEPDRWQVRAETASDRWARLWYCHATQASAGDAGSTMVGALADFLARGRFSGPTSLSAAVFWANALQPVAAGALGPRSLEHPSYPRPMTGTAQPLLH